MIRLLKLLGKLVGDEEGVAVVGHEPQLSSLAARLAGLSAAQLWFRRGAIARFDVGGLPEAGLAEARWLLHPGTASLKEGAPLRQVG